MQSEKSSEFVAPIHKKHTEIDIANQIAIIFQNADNLKALYHLIVREAFTRLHCEVAVLYIFTSSDPKKLRKVAAHGELSIESLDFDSQIELGEGVIGDLPFKAANWINLRGNIIETPNIMKSIVLHYQDRLPSRQYEHLMAISLEIGNQMFGVLKVINKKAPDYDTTNPRLDSDGFDKCDEALVKILIKQAEFSYHSIKRLEDINRIHEIGLTLTSAKKLNTILDEICRSALEFFYADIITFYQYDQKQKRFIGQSVALGDMYQPRLIVEKPRKNDAISLVLERNANHFAPDAMNDPIMSRKKSRAKNPQKQFFIFREGIVSSAAILLKVNDEAIGIMFINYRNAQLFGKEDQRLMEIFASYGAIAIKNAREKEELTKKLTFGLSEIYNIREMVDKPYSSDWEAVIPRKVLFDLLDFVSEKFGYYAEFDPISSHLTVKYTSDAYKDLQNANWSSRYGIAGYAVRSHRIQNVPNVIESSHFIRFSEHKIKELPKTNIDMEVQSSISVPLFWENEVHGVFQIDSKHPKAFSEYDAKMIQALVDQAGNAIENLNLVQEKELARRRLQALRNLDILIGTTINLDTILKLIVKSAIDLTQIPKGRGLISLIEEMNGKEYLVPYAFSGARRKEHKIPLNGHIGITRLAVLENRTMNLTDSDDLWEKCYTPIIKNMRSCLVEPLRVRGKPIGVINLESPDPFAFDKEDEDLIKVLAGQASIVIQMNRLVEDIRDIGIASLKKSKNEIIQLILEKAGELIGAKIGTIWLYDARTDTLNFEQYYGMKENIWKDRKSLSRKDSFVGYVLQNKKIIVEDIEKIIIQRKYFQKHFKKIYQLGLKSITSVPFISGKEPIGVMNLYLKEKFFSTEKEWQRSWEKNLLEIFANQASIALQNVQRYQELQEANTKVEQSVHLSIFDNMSRMVRLATHRINNSVGDVRADIKELLEKSSELDSVIVEYLQRMLESTEDALKVPGQLSVFMKELNSEKNEVHVYNVIREIVEEKRFKNIKVTYKKLRNLPHIKANFGVTKGVFLELFINAVKAMPEGGKIILSGRPINTKMLEITVKDTGHGISKKNLNKIFEYGFTEWKYAKGTGDGLAMIRAIVEVDHKGRIYAESEPGKGSTFRLHLPIYQG